MSQPHDVLVVLSHERKYPLHANALARNSVLFANILTEPNAAKLSNKAKSAGIKIRWQVELVEMESEKYPAGRLELVVSIAHFRSNCRLVLMMMTLSRN